MVPGVTKRSKTVSSLKNVYRGHGGKRWIGDGKQLMAGPHPDPDTSYETLNGSLDSNLQVCPSENRSQTGKHVSKMA